MKPAGAAGKKNLPTRPFQPILPALCGTRFANNTWSHGGTPHECVSEYHATGPHRCRLCGAQGY